jgi:transposase InsO family protein
MSWKGLMSERQRFIELWKSGQRSKAGLCREFGISRKTGYKFAKRYEEEGDEGLKDRSRAPHTYARETPEATQVLLVVARIEHPTWGPRKLKAWLENHGCPVKLPYPSTIGDLLKREGFVLPRRRRCQVPVGATLPSPIEKPNQEWDADFKGQFRLGNGEYTYPLTVSDHFSRYLLEVRALKGTTTAETRVWLERTFREYGLPETLRTDNGSPFASIGLGRLSKLAVWCIKLGIRPVRGRPHHPQDNGRHERMHRTLKAETTRPPAFGTRGQQKLFDSFREEYNTERPHEALGQKPPARLYRHSPRPYPSKLADVEYPGHYEVRRVCGRGNFTWRGQGVFATESLDGELIGLVEVEDGLWRVYFGTLELGVLDEKYLRRHKTGKVLPMSPV